MFTQTITSTWQALINYFFPVFTIPTANIFASLVTSWVLCTYRRTVCGMLLFADPMSKKAHDAYHRFFPDASWDISSLWKRLPILPWYRAKAHPSFADALAALRRRLWQERIKSMFENSIVHNKITDFLIAALSAAA